MLRAEIVIAGAGVVGASIAHHLVQRGRDVLVIDRAPSFGGGSTAKATGGFRAQFDNETEIRMSLLAREKLRAFAEETGVDPGYRPYGYLFLACSPDDLSLLQAANAVQHACGLQEAQILSAGDARTLNPAIGDDSIIAASFCPTDGFLRPLEILRGYATAAQRNGVCFLFDTELLAWHGTHIETSRGPVYADTFVNALGAWCGAPVTPLRRNVAATVATDVLPESMPMTIWAGDWYHLRVRDGRVLLLWPDDPPDDSVWLEEVLRKTHARIPCLRDLPIAEQWSGLYEMSPDGRAIVGRSARFENLWLANGSSGHGVMHAPAIGELLAQMICGEPTSIDISPLSPSRF
ncbi:MAG TPA: FAD-binding oxidoreductase [Thermoanaerobaculia bacterium]